MAFGCGLMVSCGLLLGVCRFWVCVVLFVWLVRWRLLGCLLGFVCLWLVLLLVSWVAVFGFCLVCFGFVCLRVWVCFKRFDSFFAWVCDFLVVFVCISLFVC